MVIHTFNPSSIDVEGADLCVFEASLFYTTSSTLATATQWDPASRNKT